MLQRVKVNMPVDSCDIESDFVVLISADAEWYEVWRCFSDQIVKSSPIGEWVAQSYPNIPGILKPVIYFHGGWGKVASAGSTQYIIDRWQPRLIINLGTCGGIAGLVNVGEIILVEKTVIYDIYEKMGDPDEHLKHYMSVIDNSWVKQPYPLPVIRKLLVSADRDLFCEEIKMLEEKYVAIAGDWESGAIAWVAARNKVDCLILRGVTDLVSENQGEAYDGKIETFHKNTHMVMGRLVESLPLWLKMYVANKKDGRLE
jgi:adenosylhomocysteine nucleosidase